MIGVQNTAHQRGERNQQDIGKGDAQQRHRQIKFGRIGGKAGRGNVNHPRRRQHTDGGNQCQHQREHPGNMADKFLRGFYRTGLAVFGQNRHKRLRKRAFGKNAPQQIGQFEGHKKGIGGHARAKGARNNGVAHKAENARQHGHAADFGQRAEQIHGNRLPENTNRLFYTHLCKQSNCARRRQKRLPESETQSFRQP